MKNSYLLIHEMSGKVGDEGRVVAHVLLVYLSTFHPTLWAPGSLSPFSSPRTIAIVWCECNLESSQTPLVS